MNIYKEAERCITPHLIESYFKAHGSKWVKGEYWTLSPLRTDKSVKSGTFSISENGLWKDLATGEGGNFIQLVSKKYGISKKEAAEKIIADSGGTVTDGDKLVTSEHHKKKEKPPAIIPIPAGTDVLLEKKVKSEFWIRSQGEPKKIYLYKNTENESIFCVCRFEYYEDDKKHKNHIPFYYTKEGWKSGRPPIDSNKLPFFNEHHLSDIKRHNDKIVIVEGEKAGSVKCDGYIFISWIGGTGNVDKAPWNRLIKYLKENREIENGKTDKIIIIPDNDEDGIKCGIKIFEIFRQLGITPELIDIEKSGKPNKWDIADIHGGSDEISQFISKAPRIPTHESPETPYDAFHMSISEIYGKENINQFDGLYFIYDEKKHMWTERMQINIESDVQKWIENNHVEYLKAADISIHTYISSAKTILKSYSKGYYRGNPMKDAALAPYIHMRNGAVKINDSGFEFIKRHEYGEKFFKDLYPTHCLDFDFDMSYYDRNDIQNTAPAFYYYLKCLMPDHLPAEKYESEFDLTVKFFSQLIAYCINPKKMKPKFFAMYGKSGSGKTFLTELLERIIGDQFFVKRKTNDMMNRFAAADLWGAKVFIDDDVRSDLKLPDDFIKIYSGQKSITIERKNKDAVKGVKISIAMFFISNHLFNISGGNEGIERRLIYIPYRKEIKNPDTILQEKICGLKPKGKESGEYQGQIIDERPAIVGMALRGLELLQENNHEFYMPEWIAKEREQWLIESSTVSEFLHHVINNENGWMWKCTELYNNYKEWCDDEDRKAYGKKNFYEKVKMDNRIEFSHLTDGDFFKVKGKGPMGVGR